MMYIILTYFGLKCCTVLINNYSNVSATYFLSPESSFVQLFNKLLLIPCLCIHNVLWYNMIIAKTNSLSMTILSTLQIGYIQIRP